MIVLPKFLYLFQNIPILIKKYFFHSLERSISSFIWNGKAPRIRRSALQVKAMLQWMKEVEPGNGEAWVQLEQACSPLNLRSILCTQSPPSLPQFSSNPVVYHSVRIWSQFRRHFNLQTTSVHSPLKNNYNFPPSLSDSTFGIWDTKWH